MRMFILVLTVVSAVGAVLIYQNVTRDFDGQSLLVAENNFLPTLSTPSTDEGVTAAKAALPRIAELHHRLHSSKQLTGCKALSKALSVAVSSYIATNGSGAIIDRSPLDGPRAQCADEVRTSTAAGLFIPPPPRPAS